MRTNQITATATKKKSEDIGKGTAPAWDGRERRAGARRRPTQPMERRANPQEMEIASSALPPIPQPRSAFGPARGVRSGAWRCGSGLSVCGREWRRGLYYVGRNGEAEAEMVANSCERARSFRGRRLRVHGVRTPLGTTARPIGISKQRKCVFLSLAQERANEGSVFISNVFQLKFDKFNMNNYI